MIRKFIISDGPRSLSLREDRGTQSFVFVASCIMAAHFSWEIVHRDSLESFLFLPVALILIAIFFVLAPWHVRISVDKDEELWRREVWLLSFVRLRERTWPVSNYDLAGRKKTLVQDEIAEEHSVDVGCLTALLPFPLNLLLLGSAARKKGSDSNNGEGRILETIYQIVLVSDSNQYHEVVDVRTWRELERALAQFHHFIPEAVRGFDPGPVEEAE